MQKQSETKGRGCYKTPRSGQSRVRADMWTISLSIGPLC